MSRNNISEHQQVSITVSASSAIARVGLIIGIVLVIIVVSVGVATVVYSNSTQKITTTNSISSSLISSTSSTSQYFPNSTASSVNPNGLQFIMSINSTELKPSQSVLIFMMVNNSAETNNVTGISDWRYPWLTDNLYCPLFASAVILQGFYTLSNVSSSATPVQTKEPGSGTSCPIGASLWYTGGFVLKAAGSNASGLNTSLIFSGYWNVSAVQQLSTESLVNVTESGSPYFLPFSSGLYTVVGGDEWGDITLLHFVVSE